MEVKFATGGRQFSPTFTFIGSKEHKVTQINENEFADARKWSCQTKPS